MTQDNDLWRIPESWIWSVMSDVSDVIGGGTPTTTDAGNFGGSIPWITPADLARHQGMYIDGGARWLSEKGLLNSGARWLPAGSLLFSSRAPIGYVAIASVNVTTNQGFKSFAPESCLTPEYGYYWLCSAKQIAEGMASGTTFLELSGAKAAQLPIPLPPTAEQTRIVAKLDELLSGLDAGVAELKAAQRKLQRYRQSLLKAAVEGALTADWRRAHPHTETGADLLARILRERRSRWEQQQLARYTTQQKPPPKGWQDKYPEPQAPKTDDLPELPDGWVWANVDQLSPDDLANGRSVPTSDSGPKVLRLTAIKQGRVILSESKSGAWSIEEARSFAVAEGDLLIVRGNGSLGLVGRAGLVGPVSECIAFPDTMIRLRVLDQLVLPEWISLYMDSATARSHLEMRARTSAGIYKISQPDINSMPVPVPSLGEQAEICRVVSDLVGQVCICEQMLAQAFAQSAAQRQNLLRAAFRGELVPQDPTDEPASLLLARLRAERAEAAKPARGARKTRSTT